MGATTCWKDAAPSSVKVSSSMVMGQPNEAHPQQPGPGTVLPRFRSAQRPREDPLLTGLTVWLTGLPSSGKSTLAAALAAELEQSSTPYEILDGDAMRAELSPELGFTREDRIANVRRIGLVARLLAQHGVVAIVPVIAPYASSRAAVRDAHEAQGLQFIEVHVATSLRVCQSRDVKGLYAKAANGEIEHLTGVDDPYEAPTTPDLALDTAQLDVRVCVAQILDLLRA